MLEHRNSEPALPARTVVLGAAGFVGAAVTARLTAAGAAVLPLTSKDLDLLAPDAAARLAGLLLPGDALVLVSALTPDRGRDIATFMKNLRMVETVCDALARGVAKEALAHLVYIGSDAVYHDDANPVTERSPAQPSGYHGMMHLARELMLKSTVTAPLALLRPSLLFGAADTHNGYGPNRFRRLAQANEPITLFGNGEEQRDHVLIDDVAELVFLTLTHRSAGVLNVATGQAVSFREAAEAAVSAAGSASEIRPTPRANPITHRHFDITDCLKSFPQFHYTPFADGVARVQRQTTEQA